MKANEGALHLILFDTSPLQVHTHANLKFAASTCVDAGDRGLPFASANIACAFANADSRTIEE
jgi:hypothetical protein